MESVMFHISTVDKSVLCNPSHWTMSAKGVAVLCTVVWLNYYYSFYYYAVYRDNKP